MTIGPTAAIDDLEACAGIMANTDPWITLGVSREQALAGIAAPGREVYVARDAGRIVGLAVVSMQGVLAGYLQSLAVAADARGRGLGAALLRFAEDRVFREKPNVFLFVSSFNTGARRFYEAHGYELIGEVKDFLVRGQGECLMRKTVGPLFGFAPAESRQDG